jgi:hypothetical protein
MVRTKTSKIVIQSPLTISGELTRLDTLSPERKSLAVLSRDIFSYRSIRRLLLGCGWTIPIGIWLCIFFDIHKWHGSAWFLTSLTLISMLIAGCFFVSTEENDKTPSWVTFGSVVTAVLMILTTVAFLFTAVVEGALMANGWMYPVPASGVSWNEGQNLEGIDDFGQHSVFIVDGPIKIIGTDCDITDKTLGINGKIESNKESSRVHLSDLGIVQRGEHQGMRMVNVEAHDPNILCGATKVFMSSRLLSKLAYEVRTTDPDALRSQENDRLLRVQKELLMVLRNQ